MTTLFFPYFFGILASSCNSQYFWFGDWLWLNLLSIVNVNFFLIFFFLQFQVYWLRGNLLFIIHILRRNKQKNLRVVVFMKLEFLFCSVFWSPTWFFFYFIRLLLTLLGFNPMIPCPCALNSSTIFVLADEHTQLERDGLNRMKAESVKNSPLWICRHLSIQNTLPTPKKKPVSSVHCSRKVRLLGDLALEEQ